MQIDATRATPDTADWMNADTGLDTHEFVDVTNTSASLVFSDRVFMEVETFGVSVSRRPQARINLDQVERIRLLDVLCHAQVFQGSCQLETKQFVVWLVPTDAQDGRVRLMWFQIRKEKMGYLISLSDF
jgi:hypothetical protein